MYDPTSLSYWAGSLQRSILSVRIRNNSSVKSLFLSSFDKCVQNMKDGLCFSLEQVPTNLLNLLANKAMRYDINLSYLFKCLLNSRIGKLDFTNFGVCRTLPSHFFEELSNCTNLVFLDLYGFDLNLSEFHKLKSLTKLTLVSLGCEQRKNIFSEELVNTLTCYKLTTFLLRNFIVDFKKFDSFPFLTSLSLSKCILFQSSNLITPPPLECIAISNPLGYFSSVYIPDFTLYTSTLETLRISFITLDPNTIFKSQIFPKLTELEICFCEQEDTNQWVQEFPNLLSQFCPNLSKLIFLSVTYLINLSKIGKEGQTPPFQFISHNSSPPVLMEIILNHFHNPEVATSIAKLKNSQNTYYWSRGRIGNRATLSPHFLILANLLYLNPTYHGASILIDKLEIHVDLWDVDIICGEDYLIPLVHYLRHGARNKESAMLARRFLHIARIKNCFF